MFSNWSAFMAVAGLMILAAPVFVSFWLNCNVYRKIKRHLSVLLTAFFEVLFGGFLYIQMKKKSFEYIEKWITLICLNAV